MADYDDLLEDGKFLSNPVTAADDVLLRLLACVAGRKQRETPVRDDPARRLTEYGDLRILSFSSAAQQNSSEYARVGRIRLMAISRYSAMFVSYKFFASPVFHES